MKARNTRTKLPFRGCISSALLVGCLGSSFTLAAQTPMVSNAIPGQQQPRMICRDENGSQICSPAGVQLVWCRSQGQLDTLELQVRRNPSASQNLIQESSKDRNCGTTGGVVMNVTQRPEATVEGVIDPKISAVVFWRSGEAPPNTERADNPLFCPSGSSSCRVTQPSFVCDFETAASLSEKGVEESLFLVSKKICSVVEAGKEITAETTARPNVVYATENKAHLGYLAVDLSVPSGAFGIFPDVLTGVWLPSRKACRDYARDGAHEADDGSFYAEFRGGEWQHDWDRERLLLLTEIGHQAWRVVLHANRNGMEWRRITALRLEDGVLISDEDQSTRVRCPGVPTLAERAKIASVRPFLPLRMDRNILTIGRCHSDYCSVFNVEELELVDATEDGALVKGTLRWWEIQYSQSNYVGRRRAKRAGGHLYTTYAFCSKTRPAVAGRSGAKWHTTLLAPGRPDSIFGAVESAYKEYFAICHQLSMEDTSLSVPKLAMRFAYKVKQEVAFGEVDSPFMLIKRP